VKHHGPPHCPRHGEMLIDWPEDEEPGEAEAIAVSLEMPIGAE
jgi:hypothetical protein